jgi:hypothetical protein
MSIRILQWFAAVRSGSPSFAVVRRRSPIFKNLKKRKSLTKILNLILFKKNLLEKSVFAAI